MVASNKVFPSDNGQPSGPDDVSPLSPALSGSNMPPAIARASAALVDDQAQSGTDTAAAGTDSSRCLQSPDSYNFRAGDLPTAWAEDSIEAENEDDAAAASCSDREQQQPAAASRDEVRRVSHAPTHTLMGEVEADLESPRAAAAAGGRGIGSVCRSATSDPGSRSLLSLSVATSAASAAFMRATSALHEMAMGDDHSVHDKWDDYDDDKPDKTSSRTSRSTSSISGVRSVRERGSRLSALSLNPGSSTISSASVSTEGDCSCHPARSGEGPPPAKPRKASRLAWAAGPTSQDSSSYSKDSAESAADEYADADADADTDPGEAQPSAEFMYEHATVKVLLWYYLQTMLYSGIVAAVSIPLVTMISSLHWHVDVEVPVGQDGIIAPIQPNHAVFQWMMLFWIANPLTLYCPLLLACIKRSIRLPWQMYAVCAFTLTWGAVVCGLFYAFDVPYWYWYLDLFIVLAAYVPCMCAVGWFIEDREDATCKDRLWDVAFTATLETVVAGATLLYCYFLMPLFYALPASWQKLVWLCVVHPLYFELTTGFIVRKALHRNNVLGRTNIMYFLTIVHGMAHQVSVTTLLQASVEPTRILAVTAVAYNASKLFWRSTVIHRHLFFERLLKGWSYNLSGEERTELARMVSVHVLTEVVLENASILVTPYLMYRMYQEPLFMMVVPKTFLETGGAYPADTMVTMILVLLSITVLFDIVFWYLNYHVLQFLPLINTWRRIKKARLWYLCFLINAFIFMGVLFVFLIMMLLPRDTYCKSNNYCDCVTPSYEALCKGESFTVHHDYLVEIDPSIYV